MVRELVNVTLHRITLGPWQIDGATKRANAKVGAEVCGWCKEVDIPYGVERTIPQSWSLLAVPGHRTAMACPSCRKRPTEAL